MSDCYNHLWVFKQVIPCIVYPAFKSIKTIPGLIFEGVFIWRGCQVEKVQNMLGTKIHGFRGFSFNRASMSWCGDKVKEVFDIATRVFPQILTRWSSHESFIPWMFYTIIYSLVSFGNCYICRYVQFSLTAKTFPWTKWLPLPLRQNFMSLILEHIIHKRDLLPLLKRYSLQIWESKSLVDVCYA